MRVFPCVLSALSCLVLGAQADILTDSGYEVDTFEKEGFGTGYMVTYNSEMVNAILFSEDLTTSTFFAIENDEEPDDHYTQLTLTQIFHAVLAREGGDYNDVKKISFDYLGPDIEDLADGYRDINDFESDKEFSILPGNTRWDQFAGTQLSIIAQILVPSKKVSKISFTKDYPSEMRFYSRQGMHNTMHVYLVPK